MADLFDTALLREKVDACCRVKNRMLGSIYNAPGVDTDAIYRELMSYKDRLVPMVADTARF